MLPLDDGTTQSVSDPLVNSDRTFGNAWVSVSHPERTVTGSEGV